MATATEDGAPGASGTVYFNSSDNKYFGVASFDENGVATFPGPDDPPYQADSVGQVTITLFAMDSYYNLTILDTITTNWTDNEADLCLDPPAAPSVTVGGRVTLNAKKNGTFSIALCSVDGLEVKDVDLKTVRLAGVAPWHWKYKDSKLCPDGKDGVKDLVLKFKNREVVKALMNKNSQAELADDKPVDLVLTGSMKDGTSFDGNWEAVILKEEGKMPWKKSHKQKKDKKIKECKK